MRLILFFALSLQACKSPETSGADAAPSAAVEAPPPPPVAMGPAKWVVVAGHSKVYTVSRIADADNRVKLANNLTVSIALDAMAKEPATILGIKAASQLARDAQDTLSNDKASASLVDDAGLMVLHGLVDSACREHDDVASNKALLAALREMPLPRRTDARGFVQQAETERAALDQEMQLALGEKTWKSASTGAPVAKRNIL